MKIVGCLLVRNEDWVLGLSARVALKWCDALVILLHHCTDDSGRIAFDIEQEHPGRRVTTLYDDDSVWHEMVQRDRMLACARGYHKATHVAIIDADEIITGNLLKECTSTPDWHNPSTCPVPYSIIRWKVCGLGSNEILELPGYNLRGGIHQFHANGIWSDRWFSTVFRDRPDLGWAGDRLHHREPMTGGDRLLSHQPLRQGSGGIMHLWGADERRLRAKHAWYRITERLRWPTRPVSQIERRYSLATAGDPPHDPASRWEYRSVPDTWWEPYADLMHHLNITAVPWQEEAIANAIAEHGREHFNGLDLLGY